MKLSGRVRTVLYVLLTISHFFAITLTLLRLHHRRRRYYLWWDDWIAFSALIPDIALVIVLWMSKADLDSPTQTPPAQLVRYLIGTFMFTWVVWTSRTSLALAFARIFAPNEPFRRFAIGMAILFGCTAILELSVISSQKSSWTSFSSAESSLTSPMHIAGFVASLSSDVLLVGAPLYAFRETRLSRPRRCLILSGFASSVFTTISSTGTTLFTLAPASWNPARSELLALSACLEASIALIVCNFLVVISYIYKIFHPDELPQPRRRTTEIHSTDIGRRPSLTLPPTPLELTQFSDSFTRSIMTSKPDSTFDVRSAAASTRTV